MGEAAWDCWGSITNAVFLHAACPRVCFSAMNKRRSIAPNPSMVTEDLPRLPERPPEGETERLILSETTKERIRDDLINVCSFVANRNSLVLIELRRSAHSVTPPPFVVPILTIFWSSPGSFKPVFLKVGLIHF